MKILRQIEEGVLVGLFLTALISLFFQIISRHLFVYALPWTEELARFCFLWIVFMGSAYCMRTGGHVAIDFFVIKLSKTKQKYFAVLMHSLILVFLVIVGWFGFALSFKVMDLPTIAMEISSSWEYSAVPVSFTIMAVRTVFKIKEIIKFGVIERQAETLI